VSASERIRIVDVDDYLAAERDAEVRHEFLDGELFAMPDASRAHNSLCSNLVVTIGAQLRGSGCRIASSDMKVRAVDRRRYYYPDVVVSCAPVDEEPDEYTETRPTLIVEVLSSSTASTDRREKRLAYQQIESLRELLLIAQDKRSIERYRRCEDGAWERSLIDGACPDDERRLRLESLEVVLTLDEVYLGVR